MGTCKAVMTDDISLDKRVAPHNSSLGMLNCLTGATLVFAVIKTQVVVWSV